MRNEGENIMESTETITTLPAPADPSLFGDPMLAGLSVTALIVCIGVGYYLWTALGDNDDRP